MSVEVPRLTSLSHGGGCGCKIAPGVLQQILGEGAARLPVPRDLLVGIDTADDAAVYRLNDRQAIVATTDFFMPIVDDPYDFGRIAATNAISDVYAMGGTPLFALALVAMPVNVLPTATIRRILEGGEAACAAAGMVIAGGHTIDSVEAIYGLVAIGVVDPAQLKTNAGARDGDALILGKPLGVGVYSAALKKNGLSDADYRAMIDTTTRLNTPGALLAGMPDVHAVTDVTGFGLAGHLLELCRGAKLGAVVDAAALPLMPSARAFVAAGLVTGASGRNWASYGESVAIDPALPPEVQTLVTDPQTSGGLLVACSPEAVNGVLALFAREGFAEAAVIGRMQAGAPTVSIA